ncbi:sulfatase-modifying factor enzyme 1 [Silicimonas algicola]|uniref:Sulfatase-modifying factor enzyme 1 n=1 Tax=Silicimonas algicola TaxID=1826607 RepID=A0A316GKK2_9RHOB|nr:sulfatase-modifying factor enzyme 1 [Silicimonas algicola]
MLFSKCEHKDGLWFCHRRASELEATNAHPVHGVSYNDIQLYLQWLNAKVGTKAYRLPTEAEWEYAARAGTQTPFPHGESITTDQANFSASADDNLLWLPRGTFVARGHSVTVDALDAANAWGFRHMAGNLEEMTQSCWTGRHPGWRTSSGYLEVDKGIECRRVVKGGSYILSMNRARPGYRARSEQDARSSRRGFRVVRELEREE